MGKQKDWENVLVVTTDAIAGKKIVKTLGTIQVAWLTPKNHRIKMQKKAYKMGANAIIGYSPMGGTAVIVEDE
ncbi:MAG: hypothetical protein ACFFCI_25550 [Promethearchaeota archaeon]